MNEKQTGAAVIELALSFAIFWIILFALIEFSRAMFAWNSANEATKLGARLGSICAMGNAQHEKIKTHVKAYINASGLIDVADNTNWLEISYLPDGCNESSCSMVQAKLSNVHMNLLIPFLTVTQINLPEFRIAVLRESLSNTINSESNDVCN
jgi:hypothetical protein